MMRMGLVEWLVSGGFGFVPGPLAEWTIRKES